MADVNDLLPNERFLNFKGLIAGVAILLSVATYRYFVDYFSQESDFIALVAEFLPFGEKEYSFFSHNASEDGASVSVYAQLANAVEQKGTSVMKVEPKGEKGSALENAYGVLNKPKSFGIVQSDTYLSADFLKDENRINEISKLYMERLHILYVWDPNAEPLDIEVISSTNAESVNLVENALDTRSLFPGKVSSSSRLLLPHLMDVWDVKNAHLISQAENFDMDQAIDSAIENNSEISYPRLAFFMIGSNKDVYDKVKAAKNARFLGLSPSDIHCMNRHDDIDLALTHYGGIYGEYSAKPTAGAFATLIGSNDLNANEIFHFLTILEEVTHTGALEEVFGDPPISIADIRDSYKNDTSKVFWLFVRSLIVFIITVVSTSYILSNLFLRVISTFKHNAYYRGMMEIYRVLTQIDDSQLRAPSLSEFEDQYRRAVQIKNGMRRLEKKGREMREDYNTGGITMAHHQYLLTNMNHVFDWFENKLTNRLSYVIEKAPKSFIEVKNIPSTILSWHSDGLLSADSYSFLLGRFNSTNSED